MRYLFKIHGYINWDMVWYLRVYELRYGVILKGMRKN